MYQQRTPLECSNGVCIRSISQFRFSPPPVDVFASGRGERVGGAPQGGLLSGGRRFRGGEDLQHEDAESVQDVAECPHGRDAPPGPSNCFSSQLLSFRGIHEGPDECLHVCMLRGAVALFQCSQGRSHK